MRQCLVWSHPGTCPVLAQVWAQLQFRLKPSSRWLWVWSLTSLNSSTTQPLEKAPSNTVIYLSVEALKTATTSQRQGKRAQTPRHCRTKARLLQQRPICSTITFSHAPNHLGLQPSAHPKDREVAESKLGWAAGPQHPPGSPQPSGMPLVG